MNADVHVLETQVRIKKGHSLRTELQALFTGIDEKTGEKQDKGDWATVLAEYRSAPIGSSPCWTNTTSATPTPTSAFTTCTEPSAGSKGPPPLHRYGKRREGIFCIGGVCRAVPASNGFEITFTSSF